MVYDGGFVEYMLVQPMARAQHDLFIEVKPSVMLNYIA